MLAQDQTRLGYARGIGLRDGRDVWRRGQEKSQQSRSFVLKVLARHRLTIFLLWLFENTLCAVDLTSATWGLSTPARDTVSGPQPIKLTIRLASPSQRFFPFRQAVQARAPRLATCADDEPTPSCGECGLPTPLVLIETLSVRRLLVGACPPLDTEVEGERDMD